MRNNLRTTCAPLKMLAFDAHISIIGSSARQIPASRKHALSFVVRVGLNYRFGGSAVVKH